MGDRLLIFTRYPELGRVKTRLIPALGEAGAMRLHQEMVEHTMRVARTFRSLRTVGVTVCVAESSFLTGDDRDGLPQMQQWLGDDLDYQLQVGEDLGDRMVNALRVALEKPDDRAVIIGTDCPALESVILADAFHQLDNHDVVLGPATDGGYYLIGMGRVIPELFTDIAWGSRAVLSATLAIADRHHRSVALLPMLSDVDRPEDLPLWDLARSSSCFTD